MNIHLEKRWFSATMRFSMCVFLAWSIRVLFVILLNLGAPIHAMAQSAETFSNMDFALSAIRQTFNVSTGFELVVGEMDTTPITLNWNGNSVTQMFDAIVRQRPKYVWSLKDGFYDLYPKANAQSFSQIKVADYVVRDATLREAVDTIEQQPEIERWLANNHKRRQNLIVSTGIGPPPLQERRSLALQNVTVQTILNVVYGSFGKTQWAIWNQGQDIGMSFSF